MAKAISAGWSSAWALALVCGCTGYTTTPDATPLASVSLGLTPLPSGWAGSHTFEPTSGAENGYFAWAVALGDDVAIVGSPFRSLQAEASGSVSFFSKGASGWAPGQELGAVGALAEDNFGQAVALDGEIALVGSPGDDAVAQDAGSVTVLQRVDEAWSALPEKLKGTVAGARFGMAVAVDGTTALVGAPYDDVSVDDDGSVRVFTRTGQEWAPTGTLHSPTPSAGDYFGFAVAVSGDVAVVGAPSDGAGHAFAFIRSGGSWSAGIPLDPPEPIPTDAFGTAVAVLQNRILVGAPSDIDQGLASGSVSIFERVGNTFPFTTKLHASDGSSEDGFGVTVALGPDVAVVGAPNHDGYLGGAYVFVRDDNDWSGGEELLRPNDDSPTFGNAVAVRGLVALVGAPTSEVDGRAYLYGLQNGSVCSSDAHCNEGHCVEGVCCDTRCDGACVSCLAALKASGADGECGSVAAATDPYDHCPDGDETACAGSGLCNGIGSCDFPEPSVRCANNRCLDEYTEQLAANCNGAGACNPVLSAPCAVGYVCADDTCKTTCSSASDCDAAHGFECLEGACKLPQGKACTSNHDCASGFCAEDDGICCDRACDGECEACTRTKQRAGKDGVCGPIASNSNPDRECAKDPSGHPCGADGSCDGEGRCRSYAAAGTPCGATACRDGANVEGDLCDGRGECLNESRSCEAYACDGVACLQQCETDRECSDAGFCNDNHECEARQVPHCDGKKLAVDERGAATECAPFACRGTGCLDRCDSPDECDARFDCNPENHQCELPKTLARGSSGCGVAPRGTGTNCFWLLALSAVLVRRGARRFKAL